MGGRGDKENGGKDGDLNFVNFQVFPSFKSDSTIIR